MLTSQSVRELVCELCRQFYHEGWFTGTGGSFSIRLEDQIFMTPSGVQKERIQPDDLFVLDLEGRVVNTPEQKVGRNCPKLSDCAPLFLHAYQQRNAGAVLHSHSMCCNLITTLFDGQSEVRISHQEMIKGIAGHGYFDELVIPVIENTAWEHELADSLGQTMALYPKSPAILVRRHGIYVWGDTWEQAKRHSECLHYLFESLLQYHQHGFDYRVAAVRADKKRFEHVVFDIEGTTTPITFVKDVLFPYSEQHARSFLSSNWSDPSLSPLVQTLISQARESPSTDLTESSTIDYLVELIAHLIRTDSKLPAFKQLQGKVFLHGYQRGELKAAVYPDAAKCIQRLSQAGSKVSIYSSGSREAQRLLFQYSDQGDLRRHINCYFDTKIGFKRESDSYREIALSLGADPSSILFVTDVFEEASAASAAGLNVLLSVREGNAPLPPSNTFPTSSNFEDI